MELTDLNTTFRSTPRIRTPGYLMCVRMTSNDSVRMTDWALPCGNAKARTRRSGHGPHAKEGQLDRSPVDDLTDANETIVWNVATRVSVRSSRGSSGGLQRSRTIKFPMRSGLDSDDTRYSA